LFHLQQVQCHQNLPSSHQNYRNPKLPETIKS
jgi:hypothetical protein